MATLFQAVDEAARRLVDAGLSDTDSRRDAALLARWILGWDAARWLTDGRRQASDDFTARFANAIARRATREPVAYIVGAREFYGRTFAVSRAVLIPRPETELVVDAARDALTTLPVDMPVVVDAGTGSGCLAITLALEWPAARVIATDISATALDVARVNAARHGVAGAVEFVQGHWLDDVHASPHLIVSNPPYVAERDRASLAPEVAAYEPAAALFGGVDGLEAIRTLVPAAAQRLAPGGGLIVEIGAGQADAVTAMMRDAGFRVDRVVQDLQSHPRVVVAHVPVLPHHRR